MDSREVVIKMMIVVTDGQSNVGGNPVMAAKEARSKGIIVNTIGIIDQKQQDEKPLAEIVEIAEAGGGIYEYTYIDELFQTMQSITYKTVNRTIQEAVNKQLKEIIGQGMEDMPPASRSKILNYIDSYSDEVAIQCCILMDTSGSMARKILTARHSILDLADSFKVRGGKVMMSVITYPGEKEEYKLVFDFDEDIKKLEERLCEVKVQGTTPTAPAIYYAIELMEKHLRNTNNKKGLELEDAIG